MGTLTLFYWLLYKKKVARRGPGWKCGLQEKPHVAVRQNADSVSRVTKRKYGVESQATHAPNKTIGTVVLCSKYKDL